MDLVGLRLDHALRRIQTALSSSMPLSPSDRVKVIHGISERLGREAWPLIDLTLKQFSLPTSDGWRGASDHYVLEMIQDAADGSLQDLARHVGLKFQTPPAGVEPAFWRPGMLRLFLSHLAKHRKLAAELQEALWRYGISAFVAHNDIEPTREWQLEIETALSTCHTLVALLHPGFHESNWTDQEVGFAMGRGLPVFSVRLGEDPYGFFGRIQAFNGQGKNASEAATDLFAAFCRHKQTEAVMAEALIRLFEESSSFDQAKLRIGLLEELTIWKPEFAPRLHEAMMTNSQISAAWGVPERVEALRAKWNGETEA